MMKKTWLLAVPTLFALVGCSPSTEPVAQAPAAATQPTPVAVKLTATQELEKYCRVCVKDKGEKMDEFLPARLDKKVGGKTYKFCSEPCRKQFDAKPANYLVK